jgi:hypothetical protein
MTDEAEPCQRPEATEAHVGVQALDRRLFTVVRPEHTTTFELLP